MPVRIAIDGRSLEGNRYSEARYTLNLLNHFVKLKTGHEFIVYLSDEVEVPVLPASNLILRILRGGGRPGAWESFRLPRAMLRDRVSLLFSPSGLLPAFNPCPMVATLRDLSAVAHPQWFAPGTRTVRRDRFRGNPARADRLVALSSFSKDEAIRLLGASGSRITVIHEAADPVFRPVADRSCLDETRKKHRLESSFILTAGSIHPRKNHQRLIEAVAMAGRFLGTTPMLLVAGPAPGRGAGTDIMELARSAGIQGRVKHVGHVPDRELMLLYNACGFFIYPSVYESFGLPLVEAMACGAPSACSRTASLPEIAGDAVAYFDPHDTADIASVITKLMSDETARMDLSALGIRRASAFSWEKAATETIGLFEQLDG